MLVLTFYSVSCYNVTPRQSQKIDFTNSFRKSKTICHRYLITKRNQRQVVQSFPTISLLLSALPIAWCFCFFKKCCYKIVLYCTFSLIQACFLKKGILKLADERSAADLSQVRSRWAVIRALCSSLYVPVSSVFSLLSIESAVTRIKWLESINEQTWVAGFSFIHHCFRFPACHTSQKEKRILLHLCCSALRRPWLATKFNL